MCTLTLRLVISACQNDADVLFIFDSSGSVGNANFEQMKDFFSNVIESINVGPDNAHIAVVTFNDEAQVRYFN